MAIRVYVRSKGPGRPLLLYYADPLTHREVSKSAETNDRKEAERAAARWEEELLKKRGHDGSGWEHFRRRFEDEHLAMLSASSRRSFGTALNHFERLVNVGLLTEITAGQISAFQAALRGEERPLTSIATYLTHLRAALRWAEKVEIIGRAPRVDLPRTGKRRFMRGRPITETEYRLMLAACPKVAGDNAPALRRFLELLWLSGLRLAEGLALSWDCPPVQVALDAQPYPQIVFLIEGQKSRQDDATPIPPDLAEWLSKTPPKDRRGLVAPMHLETAPRVSDLITEVGQAAGVVVNEHGKFASAHDLRRAFGTRWAAVVRPLTLQRMMRHANIETTLRFYVGLSSADAGAELWAASDYRVNQTPTSGTRKSVPRKVPKTTRKSGKAG